MIAIGIDIGNVIIGGDTDARTPAMFTHEYLRAAELPEAIETIAWLNQQSPFQGREIQKHARDLSSVERVESWRELRSKLGSVREAEGS